MHRLACTLLFLGLSAIASAQDAVRYVTDELAIVLRESASAESASRGVLTSGMRVQLLQDNGPGGYVRVRTGDGREGWILARYLEAEPIAQERVQRLEKELADAQAQLKKVRDDHQRLLADFARISGGQPVASRELVAEAEQLRETLRRNEQEVAALRARYDVERARQRTLLVGGALVGGGFLLCLLLRWLWPKRRWGDL